MKKTTKIIIILLSLLILVGGILWGSYKYLIYSDQYPFVEFSKIKRLIPDDPENAASRFLKLVQKLEKKKNTDKYKNKQVDYIVNYIEVLAITECKDSVISEMVFLNKLWENGNAETKQMVSPFIYYQKVINANSISATKSAAKEFIGIIQESAQFENKAERFGLLIYNALDSICPNDPIRDTLYYSI